MGRWVNAVIGCNNYGPVHGFGHENKDLILAINIELFNMNKASELPIPLHSLVITVPKAVQAPGGRLNIKMPSYQDRGPHVKDKMASRPSHL